MERHKQGLLLALASVLIWSTVATAFKLSLRHLASAHLLLYASVVSTFILGGTLVIQGKVGVLRATPLPELRRSLLLGGLNPCLYYLILFRAFELLPAQEAQPLNYTWAITLTLLAIPILKQRPTAGELTAMFLGYAGVVVIATRGDLAGLHFSSPMGVALALFSTVIWSLYWLYSARDSRDPVVALFCNFLCGSVFVLFYCLFFVPLTPPPFAGLLGALYIGAFEMGITYVLWLAALQRARSAAQISNLIFLSPFLSLLFIHLLVGEEIYPSTYAGLGLIVAGLLLRNWRCRR
jgi:drug/metabolite transporter (DMT)-like permease